VVLGDYAASDYGMTADSNPSFEDETLLLRGIPEETSSRADNSITAEEFLKQFQGKLASFEESNTQTDSAASFPHSSRIDDQDTFDLETFDITPMKRQMVGKYLIHRCSSNIEFLDDLDSFLTI